METRDPQNTPTGLTGELGEIKPIPEYVKYGDIPFIAEDNDGLFLYIPSVIPSEEATEEQVTSYLKTLSPISISIYRYNNFPVDTTQIIRGEKWVDKGVGLTGVGLDGTVGLNSTLIVGGGTSTLTSDLRESFSNALPGLKL